MSLSEQINYHTSRKDSPLVSPSGIQTKGDKDKLKTQTRKRKVVLCMYASCSEEWEMNYYRFTPYAEQVEIKNPLFVVQEDSGFSQVIVVVNGDGTVLDEN